MYVCWDGVKLYSDNFAKRFEEFSKRKNAETMFTWGKSEMEWKEGVLDEDGVLTVQSDDAMVVCYILDFVSFTHLRHIQEYIPSPVHGDHLCLATALSGYCQ